VLDAIRALDIMSPLSRQRIRALHAATSELTAKLGRYPTDDEVQSALGYSAREYAETLDAASCQIVSLDSATADESSPLADLIHGKAVTDPSERTATMAAIGVALRQLDDRERLVLSLYYVEDLTLQEVANVIGVHKSVIVRNHSRAILKLRTLLEVNGSDSSLSSEDENDSVQPRPPQNNLSRFQKRPGHDSADPGADLPHGSVAGSRDGRRDASAGRVGIS
jgi:RNA polymerase sigma factor for flagellar operon FliA